MSAETPESSHLGSVEKAIDLLFHLQSEADAQGVTAIGRALGQPRALNRRRLRRAPSPAATRWASVVACLGSWVGAEAVERSFRAWLRTTRKVSVGTQLRFKLTIRTGNFVSSRTQ